MKHSKILFAAFVMASSISAFGNDFSNSGTRGGGSVVNVDGRTRLRDLVEHTECEWVVAKDFIREEVGQLDALLARIAQVNWYVAERIRLEGLTLNICKSDRRLRTVPVEETDGLTIYQPARNLQQVAIRVNKDVYIDLSTFRRMPEDEKAVLFLHETLHSFIDATLYGRQQLLMNAVRYLTRMSPSTSPENFLLNLQRNDVEISGAECSDRLTPFKETFLALINPELSAEQHYAAAIALTPASHLLPEAEAAVATQLIFQREAEAAHVDISGSSITPWSLYRFHLPLTARFFSNRVLGLYRDRPERRFHLIYELLPLGLMGAVLHGSEDEARTYLSYEVLNPFSQPISERVMRGADGGISTDEWQRRFGPMVVSIYRFVEVMRPALLPMLCARPDANFPQSPCNRH